MTLLLSAKVINI